MIQSPHIHNVQFKKKQNIIQIVYSVNIPFLYEHVNTQDLTFPGL